MIPMTFYRDDEYVYVNNPDGITKKVPIADFFGAISGGGSGGGDPAILSVKKVGLYLLEDTEVESYSSLFVNNDNSVFKDGSIVIDISTGIFCPYFVLDNANTDLGVLNSGSSFIYSTDGEYEFNVYNGSPESRLISTGISIAVGVFYQLVPTIK